MPLEHRVNRVPRRPGMSLTIDRSSRRSRFSSEDLPTFGRPTMATAVSGSGALISAVAADRRKRCDDLVKQVADAFAVFGGHLDDGLESEAVELERTAARALVIGLVDRHHHRGMRRAQGAGDLLVA